VRLSVFDWAYYIFTVLATVPRRLCVSLKEWRDDRLTWEAEEFDNLTQFVVDSPLIWTPELALINAYE